MDELWESAQLCRVANVMRPYLESLIWDSQRGYRAMGYRIGGNESVK
jgi:hypothetical protein